MCILQEDRVIGDFLEAAKEETISALRAELARLQHSQHAQQAADSALASLQQKIDSLQVVSAAEYASPCTKCNPFFHSLVKEQHCRVHGKLLSLHWHL